MMGEYKIGKRRDPGSPATRLGIRGRKKSTELLEDVNCRRRGILERKVKNTKTKDDRHQEELHTKLIRKNF